MNQSNFQKSSNASVMALFAIVFSLFSLANPIISFSQDADQLISKMKKEFSQIKDFKAQVGVKVDVSYVKIPDAVGTMYFKEPNKSKIDIKGFSMLPKQGAGMFFLDYLDKSLNTILIAGKTNENGMELTILKVIPIKASNDVVLSSVYVDEKTNLIRKVETTTKQNGTFTMDIEYVKIDSKYWLPSNVNISFEVPNFQLPKTLTGDMNAKSPAPSKDGKTKGKVTLKYWDYLVNKGVDDSVFQK